MSHQPIVPPSGIEPEPLGLQPSAQTSYARVGCRAARPLSRARGAVVGACRAPVIIIIDLRLSENVVPPCAARTSGLDTSANVAGAPVIVLRPRASRAHLSPHEIRSRNSRSRVVNLQLWCRVRAGREETFPARNVEGPPGFPWAALQHGDVVHVIRVEGPLDRRRDRTTGLRSIRHSHNHYAHYARLALRWLPAVGYVWASSS